MSGTTILEEKTMSRREISDSKSSAALSMVAAVVLAFCSAAHAKGEGEAVAMLDAEQLQKVVTEAHAKFKDVKEGKNADYIPILKTIPSELFGVVIATRDGTHATSAFVPFNPGDGNTLTIDLADLDLRIAPVPGAKAFTICAGSPAP